MNHWSRFDVLAICSRLKEISSGCLEQEVVLFSYLACILLLYTKKSATEWGYFFNGTEVGAPYSPDLKLAIDTLLNEHKLVKGEDDLLSLSQEGEDEYEMLKSFYVYSFREPMLEGACASALSIPIGLCNEALAQEPELKEYRSMGRKFRLLDKNGGGAYDLLYRQLELVYEATKGDQDLAIPATLWMSWLTKQSQSDARL